MADDEDADIDAAIAAISEAAEAIVIEFTTEVVALLVETTPFLTGWARANWVPSIGAPLETVDGKSTRPKSKGKGSGSTTAGNAQQTGISAVLAYKLEQGDVYITNNVPYINRLNAGYSSQAEAGFVQLCVTKAIGIVIGRGASG